MADAETTLVRYESVCRQEGGQPNQYVAAMLKRDKQTCEKMEKVGQLKDNMNLYLAGNDTKFPDVVRLSDDDAKTLSITLCNNMYVTSLDLRYNHITDTGAGYIADLIKETTCLQQVNLMGNDIGAEGTKMIAKALQSNDTVQHLKLTGNKIGNMGGMALAGMLQINTSLVSLDVSDTDQETQSLIALATVLKYNNTLKSLNIGRPILFSQQEETTVHYANVLKVSKSLKSLHMAKHSIRDFGVTRLSENLMDNFCLLHLDLSCNRITRDGALALAELLKRDTSLKVLDLSHNRLGDAGAHTLAQALATYNTHLNVLVVSYNEMKGKGLCSLAQALHLNSSLSNLYIWGNQLEEAACIAFLKLLESGRLEAKNTDVEPYTVDGTTYLSELHHNIRRRYFVGLYGDCEQEDIIVT